MKRVLILTADFGFGHRSAANALAEAFHENYGEDCHAEIVNPLDDPRTPGFLREDQENYSKLVRQMPELYKLGYRVSDRRVTGTLLEGTWTLMLFNVLRDIVKQQKPDAIICTYPFYQGILDMVFSIRKKRILTFTVVTDLGGVNRSWFHPAPDLCFVPTQMVYNLAVKNGITPDRVKITGIPVRPELAQKAKDRASLRSELGWSQDLFTVLAIGSKRVGNLYDSMWVLNHSGFPLHLVIIAGGEQPLYQRFQETTWHHETHVFNYVAELAPFLKAADCVIGKAGGLMVSESLACGLPMILIDIIPGQETGNAKFVVNGNAGKIAKTPEEVLETMCHWLENDQFRFHQQAQNALLLGRPQAAHDISEQVWSAISS